MFVFSIQIRPFRSDRASGQTWSFRERVRPVAVHAFARGRGQGQVRDRQAAPQARSRSHQEEQGRPHCH